MDGDQISHRNCKFRKLCEGQNRTSGKDIISQLPDEVLVHILDFLPTKDAIRTSVLSSRWQFLWPLMTNIHFDDEMIYPEDEEGGRERDVDLEDSLFDSVDKFFFLHGTQTLRKFHISFMTPVSVACVRQWIGSAIRLGVQDFGLSLPPKVPFAIPHALFTSKTIHNLDIEMNWFLWVPKRVHFPCIKTLSLSYVTIRDMDSANRLFSGLPVLESLVLRDCRLRTGNAILIRIPCLRNLTIEYNSWIFDVAHFSINVYAANLVSFWCKSVLQFRIGLFEVHSSLVNAYLDLRCSDINDEVRRLYAKEMIYAVCEVKHLVLTNHTLLSLLPTESHVPLIPKFENLTRMEVDAVKEVNRKDHRICVALKDVLKQSQNLNSLRVDASLCPWEDWVWIKLPACFTNSSLKTFKISNFECNESDVKIFTLFLRNCATLKTLEVELSRAVVSNKLEIRHRVKKILDRIMTDRVKKIHNIVDTETTVEYPITYVNF